MVNSSSFDSADGNQNGKSSSTHAVDIVPHASKTSGKDADSSKSSEDDLPNDVSAVEPTPSKTDRDVAETTKKVFSGEEGQETNLGDVSQSKIQIPAKQDVVDCPGGNKTKSVRKLLCLFCDRTFVSANLRQKHVERVHSLKSARRVSARRQNALSSTPCDHCDNLNSSEHTLNDLFQHLVQEHSNKYFGCLPCSERFSSSLHLANHNTSQHAIINKSLDSDSSSLTLSGSDDAAVPHKLTRSKLRNKTRDESSPVEEKGSKQKKNTKKMGEIRTKKMSIKTSKVALKRSKRLQQHAKDKTLQKKKRREKRLSSATKSESASSSKQTGEKLRNSSINPYPEFDNFYRVKKITDHSIDNLKISSLTFDDVFDKAFFNRIKCNIEENLLHHIDGKLFKNEESENRISNFEKVTSATQEAQNSNSDNYGCTVSLNAVTPASSLSLNSQFGEDFESQIEYGSKPSKKRTQLKSDEVHYKYFTRRKYQASILQQKENRDLSKLDMWTQMVIKERQQNIMHKKKSVKELQEYATGEEYKSKIKREELNKILDRRGPFEDLKEEASKKAAFDKLNSSSGNDISQEDFTDVREILNDLLTRVYDLVKDDDGPTDASFKDIDQREIPAYLDLRRKTSSFYEEFDKSDKIALICSSQETENFELPTNKARARNELIELTGEWARSRMYICAACGGKFSNMKYLVDHKSLFHQSVWVQHYEFVGNQGELYRHLSIPGLGKVGVVEETIPCKQWKRSDARMCKKCGKKCNSLGELHRHILECGGDWTWLLARKKYKYRPYGAKARRKRSGFEPKTQIKRKTEPSEKKVCKKAMDGPRQRPSDADTIERMLANLPAKRSRRSIISLSDVLFKTRKKKKAVSKKTANVKCGKKICNKPQLDSVKSNSNQQRSCRTLRSLNKVLSSRILDLNSSLLVKRKMKALRSQRLSKNMVLPKNSSSENSSVLENNEVSVAKEPKRQTTAKKLESDSVDNGVKPVKRMLASRLNLKNFFPVKKTNLKSLKKSTSLDEISSVNNQKSEDSSSSFLNLECYQNKKGGLKGFVRSLSLRKRASKENDFLATVNTNNTPKDSRSSRSKVKQPAVMENVEAETDKKKRKFSLRKVIDKVKKLKSDKTVTKRVEETEKIKDQSFLVETSARKDGILSGKVVVPAEIKECSQGPEDLAPIAGSSTDSTENPPIPETIFNLENNEEKSMQAKGDVNFDVVENYPTKVEPLIVEPLSIKTETPLPLEGKSEIDDKTSSDASLIKNKSIGSAVSPSLGTKGKIRKPSRGLNDCIAMLTSKLQQKDDKTSSMESLFSTSSISSVDPRPLSIPSDKPPSPEVIALDLSKKSSSTPDLKNIIKPASPLPDPPSTSTWTSVDNIIQKVIQDAAQMTENQRNKVDDTIDSVVNSSLTWFEDQLVETTDLNQLRKTQKKKKKRSDDSLITNIIFGKDKLIIAPSSNCEDPLIARIKKTQSLLSSAEQVSSVFVEPSPVTLEVSCVVGKVPKSADLSTDVVYTEPETSVPNQQNVDCSDNLTSPAKLVPDPEDTLPLSTLRKEISKPETFINPETVPEETLPTIDDLYPSIQSNNEESLETVNTDSLKENVEKPANGVKKVIKSVMRKKKRTGLAKRKRLAAKNTNIKALKTSESGSSPVEILPQIESKSGIFALIDLKDDPNLLKPETHSATLSPVTEQSPETNKDVKDSGTTQRTRRKSKSSRKIDKIDNDLFKNFALVINKKTKRIPPTSIVDDSVFDDLSLFSSTNNIETDKEVLNDSVEEMDMEIEDIPINTNIIERNNAMIASRELIHLPPIKAEVTKPSNQTLELDSSKKSEEEVGILPAIQLYGNLNSEHTTKTTALSSPNDFHTPLEESTPIKPQNKKLKSKKKRQATDRKQKRTAHKETLLSEESSLSEPMVEVFTENYTKNIEEIQQDTAKEFSPSVDSGSKVVDQIITVEDPSLNNEIPTEEAATESFVVKSTALMEDSGFVERLNEDSIDKKTVDSVLVGDTLENDSKNDHRSFKLSQSAEIIRDSPRKKSQSVQLPEDNKSNLSSGLKSKRARKLVNYNEDNFDSLLLTGLEQLNATNSKKSKRNESKALEGFVKNGATVFKASEFSEIPKLVVDIHHVDQIDPMLHNYLVKDATIGLTSLETFGDGCIKSNVLEEDASILTGKNEVENPVHVGTSGVDEMEGELTNQPEVDETVAGEANMEKDSSILRRARKSKKNNKHTSNESSVELNVLDTTTVQLSTQDAVENCTSSKKPLSELRRTRKSKKVNSDVKNGSNVGLNVLEEITTPTSNADQKLDTDLSAQGADSVDESEMQDTVLNYKTASCNELNRNIFGSYVEMKVLEEITPVPSIDDLNHKLKIESLVQVVEPICDGSKSKRNKKSKKNISSDAVNSFNITIDVPEELQTTADDLNHKADDQSFPQNERVTDDFNHGKEYNDASNDICNGTNIGINVLEEITPTSTAGDPSEFLAQIVADKSEPILKRGKKSKKNLSYSEANAEDDFNQKPQTALQALVDDEVSVGKKLKRSKKKKNLKHKETGEDTNIDLEIVRKVTSTSTVSELDNNSLSLLEGERNRSKSELKRTKKLKNDISYSDIINGSNVDLNVLKTSIPTTEDLNQKAEVPIPLVAELVEDGKKASSFAINSDVSELNCLETSTLIVNQKSEIPALVAEEKEVKSDSAFEHNSKLIKDISYNEVNSVEFNAETTISSEVNENCRVDIQLQVEPAKKTDKTDLKRSKKSKKTVSNSGNVELNELKDDTLTRSEGCLNHKPEIELPFPVAKSTEEENSESILSKKSKKNHYSIEMNSTIGGTTGYEELIQPVDVLNHKHEIELPTLDPEPENDKSDATILRPSRRSKKNVNYNEEELFNMAELNYNNTATQKKRKSICKPSQVECKDLSLADKLDVSSVQVPQFLEDAPAVLCDTPQEKVYNLENITNNNAAFQIKEVNEFPREDNNDLECIDTTELDSCMLNKKRKNDRSAKKLKNNMDLDVANILEVEKRSTRRKKSLRDDNGDDVEDSQRFENETSSPLLQQINSLQNELAVDHFTGVKAATDFGDIGDISPQLTVEREEIDRDLFEKSSVVVREEPTNPVLVENREAELAKINIKNLLLSSLPSPRNLTDIPPEVVVPVENVISETKQKKKKSSSATDKKKKVIPSPKLTIATLKDVLSSFSESKTDSVFSELPPLTDIITSSEMDIAPVLDEIDKSLESEDIYDFSDDFYDETEESSIIKPIHKTNNSEEVTEPKRRPSNRFAKLKALENIHEVALSDSQANMVLEENKRCKKKTKLDRVVQEQFSGAEIENHIPLIQIGVDTPRSPQSLEPSSLEVEPTETTQQSDEAQELRRSRRGSRKVPSYNENDLIDPLIDALEKTRARGARKEKSLDKTESKVQPKAEDAPKLSSDELFDMLKKSSLENANPITTKPLDAFADVFNEDSSNSASRGLTEGSSDNSDTVKAQYAEKIYEFTEDSPENTKTTGDILGKNKKVSINFHKARDQDYVDLDKTLPVDNVHHEQSKQNYCDICKKSFIRLDSLVKHRATLTHISKLSELEAREAEEKAKLQKEVVEEQQKLENESLKAYISISDILQTASPSPRRLSKESPVLSSGLNLVDIISDVLNKPITNEYNIDKQNFNDQREDVSDGSSRRYKSLGERKSFESTDQLMPVSSQATILEKQINLLENIIGSNLDRMATDQKSGSNFDAVSSCSNLSYADSLMVESQNQRATVCESDFIKPTQYEEISEDSSNTKMYEDQKQRKTLNRDEELFLECCSLLKSGSEVSNSNYSKKVETVNKQFDKVMKPEIVNEKLVQGEEDAHEYSDNSRTPTPLGDTYDDEASNSNTISSNWHLNPDPVKHKDETGINFSDVLGKELRNMSTQFVNTQQEEESDRKNDSDSSSASKKVATKGARKVYEGLKVSIPTEDLNLDLLNGGSLVRRSPSEDVGTPGKTKQARKSKPVKKAQIGSNLLFKVNKKKTPQDTSRPVSEKMFDVFNFEETQDYLPNNESLVKLDNHTDDDSLGYADSIGADAKSVSSGTSMSIISARKQESSPENITKNKYKIMGKIFKNAAKSKADMEEDQRNIPEIPEMDNRELVENYVRSCQDVKSPFLPPPPPPPCDELPKKPKMTEEEMNMLFDQLVGKNSTDIQLDKEPLKPPSKPKTSESKKKSSGKVNKGRKRTRVNSGSSDDEFNISSKTRKRAKKKNDQEDSGINLELELKECIGVASRKSQRTCTSGKQNVLVEYWSSDEEEALIENSKAHPKQTQIEETTPTLPIVQAAPPSLHMQPPPAPPKPKLKKKPRKKPKANNDTRSQEVTSQVTVTSNRRKRAAANPLYHWSSSSEDESQSLIEIKPLREEEDDDDDRPVQHGWIVGDSPKKLVTMLALTKGKKNDFDSVKEQGKKRSSNTTS